MILHHPGPLRLGLALPNQFAGGSSLADGVRLAIRMAAQAAELGYSALLAGEHRLSDPYPYCDPIPLLARASSASGEADLIAMSLLALHHPVDVVEQLATLDAVSGGRAVLCAALGYRELEYRALGVEWSTRVARFEEAIRLVEELSTQREVAFHGTFFDVPSTPVCTPFTRPGGLPVWRAASVTSAVARAGAQGATWLMGPTSDFSTLHEQQRDYQRAGAAPEGVVPIVREVIVAHEHDRAVELAERFLWPKYQTYQAWGQERAIGESDSFDRPLALLGRDRFVIGTVDEAVATVVRMVEQLGVDLLVVHPHWPDMPDADAFNTVELMAREVLPRVHEALAATTADRTAHMKEEPT
jgi:alkanesulfonate monooxygenase SsuD/methylene tetrahydromethanopterin reductase-like flavin-dependent oxidoreductase (luciferase family)